LDLQSEKFLRSFIQQSIIGNSRISSHAEKSLSLSANCLSQRVGDVEGNHRESTTTTTTTTNGTGTTTIGRKRSGLGGSEDVLEGSTNNPISAIFNKNYNGKSGKSSGNSNSSNNPHKKIRYIDERAPVTVDVDIGGDVDLERDTVTDGCDIASPPESVLGEASFSFGFF
jgi:hypothetical protein